MSRKNPRFHRFNAPLPALTGNIFQAAVMGTIENQVTMVTFNYLDSGPVGSPKNTAEADIGAGWLTANKANFLACCSADYLMTGVRVTCLNIPSRIPVLTTAGGGSTGVVAGGHAPVEVAPVVIRKTQFKGQSGRGRFSLPGVALSSIVNSQVGPPLQTAVNSLISSLNAGGTWNTVLYTHVLVSRRGVFPNITYGCALVTSMTLSYNLGTVRRRKPGRGR